MRVEWRLVAFGPSQFRLVRLTPESDGMSLLDIVAEQPEGTMIEAMAPYLMPEGEEAFWAGVARQRRDEDRV